MELTEFWTICSGNGIILDKEQLRSLERFKDELIYWNEKVNLISRKDIDNIMERHILHSLLILKYIEFPQRAKCLDLGTGGGLPGVPLKIARPDLHMLLVDSIKKKLKIADMLGHHTGLKNIRGVVARAEELAEKKEFAGYFDFILSRAVGKTVELISWSKPLLKKNGQFVFLKGGDLNEEIAAAKQKFPKLVIIERPLTAFGLDFFEKEEKKIMICRFE